MKNLYLEDNIVSVQARRKFLFDTLLCTLRNPAGICQEIIYMICHGFPNLKRPSDLDNVM